MNRISLNHVETLLWIARLGTFSAAAARLNMSQPSVSQRMRELEHLLQARLFQREGRRMLLTVKGRQLVQQLEPLWFQIETTLLPAGEADNLSGIVKVGCGEIVAVRGLPEFLSEMSRRMAGLCFEVEVDLTINLRHKLESGLIDMAIMVGPIDNQGLIGRSIGRIGMHWYVSAALLDGGAEPSTEDAMTRWPVWCLSRPSHLYEVMTDAFRQSDKRMPLINTCNNVRALIDIILRGGGIAILPEVLVKEQEEAGALVRVADSRFDTTIEFFRVVRRSEGDPVVLEVFRRADAISLV